jgi:hypothetical protein
MNKNELPDKLHELIHALRLIKNYKPTMAEQQLSQWVIECYPNCKECSERAIAMKYQPQNKSILDNLFGK